jgi:hypothetical protein
MKYSGITIDRDANGVPLVAHIDMRKYGNELKEFFMSKGIVFEDSSFDSEDDLYFTPEVLAEIDLSLQQAKEGKVTKVSSRKELSEFLESL